MRLPVDWRGAEPLAPHHADDLYSTGLRRAELCRLKVADVDSKRMMLRVVQGKGGIDREVPLSKKLLGALREYYRWMRPETYLFPGTVNHSRADKPKRSSGKPCMTPPSAQASRNV